MVTLAQGDWVGASGKCLAQDFLWIISALWSFSRSAKCDDTVEATSKKQVPLGRKGKGRIPGSQNGIVHCMQYT